MLLLIAMLLFSLLTLILNPVTQLTLLLISLKKDPLCTSFHTDFKSKLDLAQELVELSLSRNIPFSHIVFDNWYFSNDFASFLNSKYLKWISEVEKSRLIRFRGKWIRA
jgi:hypothetical protein